MLYYAKVNTATPATGLITIGSVLTDKQVKALGEEKLAELVRENVIVAKSGQASTEEPEGSTEETLAEDLEAKDPESATTESEEYEDEDEEELPELSPTSDIVSDETNDKPKNRKGKTK